MTSPVRPRKKKKDQTHSFCLNVSDLPQCRVGRGWPPNTENIKPTDKPTRKSPGLDLAFSLVGAWLRSKNNHR
jgi:hypothetical protein